MHILSRLSCVVGRWSPPTFLGVVRIAEDVGMNPLDTCFYQCLGPAVDCGFTLVELAVTLSISAILAAIAVPNMQQFLTGRAVDSQAEELVTSLRMARSEALKRGAEVSVCASSNTESASPSCSGDTGWVSGWLVFYDDNVNGTLDGKDKPVRVQGVAKSVKEVASATQTLTFGRNGTLMTSAASFKLKPNVTNTSLWRTVCLNKQGRVSLNKGDFTCP